jgi:hypothetical protein
VPPASTAAWRQSLLLNHELLRTLASGSSQNFPAPSMDLACISGPNQAEQYGVGALSGSVSGAYRTFQTVS